MTFNFRTKILLLVIVPLILISTSLIILTINQAKNLGKENISSFSETIYKLRRDELKNYTDLALTSIKHIYNRSEEQSAVTQEDAKEIIRNLSFGSDGYFFVYDYEGKNIVHPKKPQLEGKNLWNIKDANGVYLIRSLVQNAKQSIGGYTEYVWDKPSKGRDVDKISFSMGLENWEWMIGTGLYTDDLDDAIQKIETEVSNSISKTLLSVIGLAVSITAIVGFIGIRYTLSEANLADSKLKTLSHRVVQSQEEEKARVSLDLQKNINQKLAIAVAELKAAVENNQLKDPSHYVHAVNTIEATISDIYHISGELRPEMLSKKGLYYAVKQKGKEISQTSEVDITFKINDLINKPLSEEIEIAVYRIVLAAIDNMIQHSQATKASVRIRRQEHNLSINIQDNGIGFDASKDGSTGLGIADMRLRAEALGGTLSVFSSPKKMTTIRVELPLTTLA